MHAQLLTLLEQPQNSLVARSSIDAYLIAWSFVSQTYEGIQPALRISIRVDNSYSYKPTSIGFLVICEWL